MVGWVCSDTPSNEVVVVVVVVVSIGGRCSRRNGIGDEFARRMVDFVNEDSEMSNAIMD